MVFEKLRQTKRGLKQYLDASTSHSFLLRRIAVEIVAAERQPPQKNMNNRGRKRAKNKSNMKAKSKKHRTTNTKNIKTSSGKITRKQRTWSSTKSNKKERTNNEELLPPPARATSTGIFLGPKSVRLSTLLQRSQVMSRDTFALHCSCFHSCMRPWLRWGAVYPFGGIPFSRYTLFAAYPFRGILRYTTFLLLALRGFHRSPE